MSELHEDCIPKVMENDNDWYNVFDSVLFACHIATPCSTGVSPYCMVFNKNPILPFKYKDKLNFHSDDYLDDKCVLTAPNGSTKANGTDTNRDFPKLLITWKSRSRRYFLMLKPK